MEARSGELLLLRDQPIGSVAPSPHHQRRRGSCPQPPRKQHVVQSGCTPTARERPAAPAVNRPSPLRPSLFAPMESLSDTEARSSQDAPRNDDSHADKAEENKFQKAIGAWRSTSMRLHATALR